MAFAPGAACRIQVNCSLDSPPNIGLQAEICRSAWIEARQSAGGGYEMICKCQSCRGKRLKKGVKKLSKNQKAVEYTALQTLARGLQALAVAKQLIVPPGVLCRVLHKTSFP
jgi:hypothetical protein